MLENLIGKLMAKAECRITTLEALDHPWFAMRRHRTVEKYRYLRIAEFLDFEEEPIKKVVSFP